MIQRLQSVFLLITAMALAVFLGTNTYIKTISPTESVTVNPFQLFHQVGTLSTGKPIYYIAVLASIALIVSLVAIFMYKNRLRQMIFASINSIVMMLTLGVSVYHILTDARPMVAAGEETFQVGFFALIIAMVSNLIANRLIKRDEKLVRSADRMR
jgi:hypothetical protein